MSLIAIKSYLTGREAASLSELSYHFGYEPEMIRAMLSLWVKKGKVRCWRKTSQCGSKCNRCAFALTEMYAWVEA